ncbi:hypothetical protein ABPG77_010418 [Micractinium sp. CCAP 211/92]
MDVQAVLVKAQALWQQVLADPLVLPMAGSLAALVCSIALLYWCAAAGERAQKKRENQAAGTVFEGGVRRSTRVHKQPDQFEPAAASPAPARTPRATRTPKTAVKEEKEAVTVTPKATRARTTRAAAAKTPATVEPATTRTTRRSAKTPAK